MANISKTTTDKKLLRLPTKITSFQEVEKALLDITVAYNKLVESTNADGESEVTNKDGKTGDVRITRNTDKTYKLEIKSEEGWKFGEIENTDGGTSVVKYVDASRIIGEKKLNAAERLEAQGYTLPRPDYDSGWVNLVEANTSGTHNLGVKPTHFQYMFTNDNGITSATILQSSGYHHGFKLTSTTWEIRGSSYYGHWPASGWPTVDWSGYKVKILLWK
jgi:hypothetical protein